MSGKTACRCVAILRRALQQAERVQVQILPAILWGGGPDPARYRVRLTTSDSGNKMELYSCSHICVQSALCHGVAPVWLVTVAAGTTPVVPRSNTTTWTRGNSNRRQSVAGCESDGVSLSMPCNVSGLQAPPASVVGCFWNRTSVVGHLCSTLQSDTGSQVMAPDGFQVKVQSLVSREHSLASCANSSRARDPHPPGRSPANEGACITPYVVTEALISCTAGSRTAFTSSQHTVSRRKRHTNCG